jgi:23S rRNA pseudouridine1911/1915/1917 synthase
VALNDGHVYREQLDGRSRGRSLVAYLADVYRHTSATEWTARLAAGEVLLDGRVVIVDEPLRPGAWLEWRRPPWAEEAVPTSFRIVHEDDMLLVVDKPSGLPTMPAGGFLAHTLLTVVRRTYPEAVPMHRLGRFTSGLVVFARTAAARSSVQRAWREHEVAKTYRALASGVCEEDALEIRTPIGPVEHPRLGTIHAASAAGRPSQSVARVVARRDGETLFGVDITTGRPHQIRIHLAAVGHPLVGDPLYGPGGVPKSDALPGDGGYHLHAWRLSLAHPADGRPLALEAELPERLRAG